MDPLLHVIDCSKRKDANLRTVSYMYLRILPFYINLNWQWNRKNVKDVALPFVEEEVIEPAAEKMVQGENMLMNLLMNRMN